MKTERKVEGSTEDIHYQYTVRGKKSTEKSMKHPKKRYTMVSGFLRFIVAKMKDVRIVSVAS